MNREPLTPDPAPSTKFTYDDFMLFPDDGKRHEIIDGVHYVTPSPNLRHQAISGRLFFEFYKYLEVNATGSVWAAPLDVVLSRFDVVEPDLLYVSHDNKQILTTANVKGAPDLAIEIFSPGTRKRDEGIKLRAYDRCGVGEYWLVDPVRDLVRVYRRGQNGFEHVAELSAESNDCLTSPLLPDLSIDLAVLFRE